MKKLPILFIIMVALCFVPTDAQELLVNTERAPLRELYNNTGGDMWTIRMGWRFEDYCSWYGIVSTVIAASLESILHKIT